MQEELDFLFKLDHKAFPKIFEYYKDKNYYQLVLEQLDEQNLQQILNDDLNLNQIQILMITLLEGLSYLHDQKIMHTNISPSKILFRNEKDMTTAVLYDFSNAQNLDQKSYFKYVCGDVHYTAPEILFMDYKNQKNYSEKCDLFSLGCVFYQLLFQEYLFPEKLYKDIRNKKDEFFIDYKKKQFQKIPTHCLDLLRRMLEMNPEQRISAKEALQHPFLKNIDKCDLSDDDIEMPSAQQLQFNSFKYFFYQKQYKIRFYRPKLTNVNKLQNKGLCEFTYSIKEKLFDDSKLLPKQI